MKQLISALVLTTALVLPTAHAAEPATVGKAAPDFTLKDESGKTHKLSDYRGKTVVLEWTNPECPFVVRHYKAKTMTRTHAPFASKDVVWLAIDSTSHNTPQKSSAWKKKEGFKYPVLQDASGKVGRAYGAKTTPHMYVIDKDGVLRFAGGIDDDPRGRSKSPNNFVTAALTAVVDGKTPAQQHSTPYGCTVKYAAEGS
ncbi:MAG TPA: redoxin domain-containing protein [Myxococcaceae bacterium]|nr:redoxin domain-containing protein [Myxococcaceae bacterium]